jgi:hypothetical protein
VVLRFIGKIDAPHTERRGRGRGDIIMDPARIRRLHGVHQNDKVSLRGRGGVDGERDVRRRVVPDGVVALREGAEPAGVRRVELPEDGRPPRLRGERGGGSRGV